MATTFRMKRHDTYPPLGYTIRDANGDLLDMSGGTVRFTMTNKSTNVIKVNRAAGTIDAVGHISYSWAAADVNAAGSFWAEFEVTLSTGRKFTAPNDNSLVVAIEEDLDNV